MGSLPEYRLSSGLLDPDTASTVYAAELQATGKRRWNIPELELDVGGCDTNG
jgi:hypothetical protein